MEILFLSDNFPPESNAPANRTYEHAREWVTLGHSVTVITCAPNFPNGEVYPGYQNKWYQVESMEGIRVVRVKTYMTANEKFTRRVFDFLSFMIVGLVASLFQRKPDVIVATSPQFFCGIAGALSALLKRVPFVLEVRDLWPESIVAIGVMPDRPSIKLLRLIEGWMYRRASLIIVVSEAFRASISDRISNDEKIKVVLNGVDTNLFNQNPIIKPPPDLAKSLTDSVVVGYIGTHGAAHGLITVLQAAKQLQAYPEIHFLLIGAGEKKHEVDAWADEHQLDNVTLLPHQPRSSIPGLMSLCDVALVPLRNLPLFRTVIPSKIFEYMAMGIPIVISVPEGAATNIIKKSNCGLLVEPQNPEKLEQAILKLYQDKALQVALGNNGQSASIEYRREQQARTMLNYINDTVQTVSQKR